MLIKGTIQKARKNAKSDWYECQFSQMNVCIMNDSFRVLRFDIFVIIFNNYDMH